MGKFDDQEIKDEVMQDDGDDDEAKADALPEDEDDAEMVSMETSTSESSSGKHQFCKIVQMLSRMRKIFICQSFLLRCDSIHYGLMHQVSSILDSWLRLALNNIIVRAWIR